MVRVTASKPAPFTVEPEMRPRQLQRWRLPVRPGGGFRHPLRSAFRPAHRRHFQATLILTGATNFKNYRDVSADPAQRNAATLAAIGSKSYEALRAEHIPDHQALFRRVSLDLGATPAAELPTDERIAAFANGSDPHWSRCSSSSAAT